MTVKDMMGHREQQLAQKELENQDLKRKVFEWKKKALEKEALYHTTIKQFQAQEQQLIARHQSEMEALTAIHVEKMNHLSSILLSLQQQSEQSSFPQQVVIEERETPKVIHHRQKATDLILNMNELMSAIEIKIHGYMDDTVDDTMNASSDDDQMEDSVTPEIHHPRLKSKPTLENLTKVIPNFLLKTSGKSEQWKMTSRQSMIKGPPVTA
ncbi:hypothetical protein BC941DRAFT_407725 [Chlamydoabsidia padenii]|nr:hypothetical protein BC941DRAFT_407725 [Chlamydoabsidia padenii]